MDRTAEAPPPIPSAWPVLAGLGGVILLVVALLGVDLVVARRTARRTAEIVENAQRSIEIVDDLRAQAQHLAAPGLTHGALVDLTQRIAADARAYDPTATSVEEREEWNRLQGKLARLERSAGGKDTADSAWLAGIGQSIDRLVVINREAAHSQADAIRHVQNQAIVADASVGALTLLLVGGIVLLSLRILRRQRTLTARHIALVEERNRELDAFAARAAHDLRAPLNPIRGYADLLLAGDEPPEEIRQMASRIRLAVDRMARVVDDMLELSRAGRPASGKASPAEVGAQVLDELGPELRGAELHTELTDEKAACAPGVLAQILRNLLGNAVKFRSRQRPLAVRLSAAASPDAIEILVEDNGTGMDAESAMHAFEAYYRGPSEREVPGHGLGLAIVERAVRALGGRCSLSSTPDFGTRVTVRLPRA
ncbi:MAG TPA: ATP-binding protein [Polyangia bacterium]